MSKISDYKIEKFTSLKDTPNTYDPGKYVKVLTNGLDYDVVNTSTSGSSGGGLNYNYYFDTAVTGTVASGCVQLNATNYPGVSEVNISYFDKDGNDLSNWINSWDDSDKSVKGTLTFQSVSYVNKYAMFKLEETANTVFGSGKDGDVTISGSVNLNTDIVASGRSYPDMVAYNVSSVGASSCQTMATPNGIVSGDAVLLINLQGAGSTQVDNVGNYEIFIVDSVVNTTVTFKSNKTKLYGNNGGDSNLGVSPSKQRVMLMRIPQYNNLTIESGAELSGKSWDGTKYGVVACMVKNSTSVIGSVVSPIGYRGTGDHDGESYGGFSGLGGGHRYWSNGKGGGSGAYASNGLPGLNGGSPGGTAYGVADLSKIYFGSAGGAESSNRGGHGGGIVLLFSKTLDVYGNISSNGTGGVNYGGSGAGGSILLKSNKLAVYSSTIEALGATRMNAGSNGRIAIYYNALMDSLSAVNPTPYTDSLTSGADKINYNVAWLNNSGKFNYNEEIIVSYAYNY